MKAVNYTDLRKNLANYLDEVIENHTPILVTRNHKGVAVLMNTEDFISSTETWYLNKYPSNAKHLLESVAQIDKAKHQK